MDAVSNPFRYGSLALDDAFTDREREVEELTADVLNGQDVVVFAPRRYGKTSLVWRVERDVRAQGVLVAHVDLMAAATKERLAEKLARTIHEDVASRLDRAREWALGVFRGLRIAPRVTVDPTDGSLSFAFDFGHAPPDVDATLERLLELPGILGAERGRRVALVLDEFQEIVELDRHLPRLMRSVFQRQPDVAHGAAGGAATPISPSPGAVVESSHPVFSWSIPPNEESDGIVIADAPETTVEGEFYDENVVDLDVFFANETSWSPSSPLPARTYWWNVWSHDTDTFDRFYSAPVSFTIPARARITSIGIRRYTFIDNIDVTVRFTANTEEARIAVRLRRGSRTVWSKTELDEFISIGETNTAYFSWFSRGRIRQGTRLQLQVTIDAGGAHASATRAVRAP